MASVTGNLEAVRGRIAAAAQRSGRKADEVELLVVTKTFPAEVVREAVDAGQKLFGENKVQELLAKMPLLPSGLRWHLIGHLQSNKVRKVLPVVEVIHSVTSLDLARDIDRIAGELGLHPRVYLEVNVGAEASKHGFDPKALPAQLEDLYRLERLYIEGLMCIPPFVPAAEQSRPFFAALRELRDQLEKAGGAPLPKLSMGMSHDFEVAVEEGATIVRVGSAVFGRRPPPSPPVGATEREQ